MKSARIIRTAVLASTATILFPLSALTSATTRSLQVLIKDVGIIRGVNLTIVMALISEVTISVPAATATRLILLVNAHPANSPLQLVVGHAIELVRLDLYGILMRREWQESYVPSLVEA